MSAVSNSKYVSYMVFAYEHVALPKEGAVLWDEIGEKCKETTAIFFCLILVMSTHEVAYSAEIAD